MSSDHKARAALLIRPGERNLAMFRIAIVLAIAAAVTPWAAAGVRAEACDNGICADGRDDGRTLNVYLRTTMTGMSHYNIRVPGRSQFESTGRFQIPTENTEAAAQAEYITLLPNVQIGVHSDQLFYIIIEPISPDCTNERIAFYYLEPAANSADFTASRDENISWWRNVFTEDVGIIERLQRGRCSPAFQGGCFSSVMDVPTHHFHRWVARRTTASVAALGRA